MWLTIKRHWDVLLIILIVIFGFVLRVSSIYPNNIIFDFDQTEDLYYTQKLVVDKELVIIGRPIYGNVNFRHGVLFFYFIALPFALSNGNPVAVVIWNSLFNAGISLVLFFLGKKLFKSSIAGLISGLIVAVSNEFIQYSGWISNPPLSMLLVSLFFLSLWYLQKHKWVLPISTFLLGLSIQSHLFYLYLIPVFALYWVIYKPKVPTFKMFVIACCAFLVSISTFILTEIKLHFSTTRTILNYLHDQPGGATWPQKIEFSLKSIGERFSLSLWPQNKTAGVYLFIIAVALLVAAYFRSRPKNKRRSVVFLLIFFLSPLIMLLLGYHEQPWFFVGMLPPLALVVGYIISSLKIRPLIIILVILICYANIKSTFVDNSDLKYSIFRPEKSILLPSQLAVIDYLYQDTQVKPFAFNAVSYPLYNNGMWAYHFNWYGKRKYGYLPIWLGGKQLHPYDSLPEPRGNEKEFYFIVDLTTRIPVWTRLSSLEYIGKDSTLIKEVEIDGFLIQHRVYRDKQ